MKIFKGQLTDVYAGTFTPAGYDSTVDGNYITTYTSPSRVRESGVTKVRTKPLDMSQYIETGKNRMVALWSHINGSNQVQGASGCSIQITYQVAPSLSGCSWYTVSGKFRTGGTSISGVSGTHLATLSSPVLMPWWRLEFCGQFKHSTSDMTVDYALVLE